MEDIIKIVFFIIIFFIFFIILSSCITIEKKVGGYVIRHTEKLSENPNIRTSFSLSTEDYKASRNVIASFYFSVYTDIQVNTFEFVTGFIQAGKQKIPLNIERMNHGINRGALYVNENDLRNESNRIDLDREFVRLGSPEIVNEKISIYIEFKINNENYILDINEANMEIRYYKRTLADLFLEHFVYPHVRIF